jgi:DNA-binding transcriptional ArsR family regulator
MRSPELEARHTASADVSQLFIVVCLLLTKGYNRDGDNLATLGPEIFCSMVVRLNDHRRRPSLSVNQIAKITGLPRANVQRWMRTLEKQGVVRKSGKGYIGNDAWLEARRDAPYFKRIVRAIIAAARRLEKFKK